MNVEVQPYFAEGDRYPALIGVRAEGDEYETVYVSKSELVDALAENTKLWELVVTLMACVSVDDCDKCPINGAEFKVSEVSCCREAKQRMLELGIEVYG